MSKAQSRKSHTKSRLGCSACKQRHQKCDETRPSCVNCVTARRHCPYLDEQCASEDSMQLDDTAVSRTTPSRDDDGEDGPPPPIQLLLHTPLDNLIYIELLQLWLSETYRTCTGPRKNADPFGMIAFNHALNSPFLMRSMLAVSAQHRASQVDDNDEKQKFLVVSEKLQAEGLSRFTTLLSNLDTSTIVPAFLFAFITGIHHLCQTLSKRHQTDGFFFSLIDSMNFVHGVQIIITGWWPYLMTSELSTLLSKPNKVATPDSLTEEPKLMSSLQQLLSIANFDSTTSEIYRVVIDSLEKMLVNPDLRSSVEPDTSVGVIVVWMIRIPSEFVQYLRDKEPVAMIVLAHSAPLLHYRRDCWAIGDAGKVLVDVIATQLSPSWLPWLDWPRSIVNAT